MVTQILTADIFQVLVLPISRAVRLSHVQRCASFVCLGLLLALLCPGIDPLIAQALESQTPLTYKFLQPSREANTSFELNSNHIYCPVRVNGTGPYWFMLDSGAIFNVLDTELAKSLGVKSIHAVQASGGGEQSVTGAVGSQVSFRLSELQVQQTEIELFPIAARISPADGRTVSGLLGYDFLRRFIVKIDYPHRRIDIFEPTTYRDHGSGEVIPLDIIRGNIFAHADLTMPDGKRVSGTFLIDTGWRSALTLASPFVANQKLVATVTKTIDATTGMGIGGPTVDTEARIKSLKIGRFQLDNVIADFSQAKAGVLSEDNFAGVIGGEILRRFTVVLDYPHHRMIIAPNQTFATPYDIDMSGLFLTSEAGSGRFKVYSVVKGSPAAEAGILEGDVIEAVDDKPVSQFNLEQMRQMFKGAEGAEHRLTLGRQGRTRSAKFRLRRLI